VLDIKPACRGVQWLTLHKRSEYIITVHIYGLNTYKSMTYF